MAKSSEKFIAIPMRVAMLFSIGLFAILATLGWSIGHGVGLAHTLKTQACSTAWMFESSIRISGNRPQGELGKVYEQWRQDVKAGNCPERFRPPLLPTTTKAGD